MNSFSRKLLTKDAKIAWISDELLETYSGFIFIPSHMKYRDGSSFEAVHEKMQLVTFICKTIPYVQDLVTLPYPMLKT
jgi:hypothetical protein